MAIMALRRKDTRPEVRRAIARFLLLNLLAMILVAAGAIGWSAHVANAQAVRTAARTARSIATHVIAPLCTPELLQGDAAAIAALDDAIRERMRDGSMLRVKIWTPEGRIIYSDASELIGRSFPLDRDDQALLGTDRANASISPLDRPENKLEAAAGRLVETYAGIRSVDGNPLLFEAYFPAGPVDADAGAIARDFTPTALATILALQLLQLPLALALARRLDRAHGEHRRLLEHAVAASELERRRVARDLHDGVAQDLAGVAYMLESLESRIPPDSPFYQAITRATGVIHSDVRSLRRTMVELYPPDLATDGLEHAIAELAGPVREAGIHVTTTVDDTSGLEDLTVQLLYRACRELLRNVVKHADATEVTVTVSVEPDQVALVVADNGAGFDAQSSSDDPDRLGLRLLTEAVQDAGGSLRIDTAPGSGTTASASLTR
jgi:two-component system NarL family sensor kinase